MFGLPKHGPDGKYAVVLDIGSASVGAAIVASDAITDENPIIYSKRIQAVIRDASSEKPTRAIEEALMQIFLDLSGPGIQALAAYERGATIGHIQLSISAPWSHTVSQQAEYTEEEVFKVSENLLETLVSEAQKKVDGSFNKATELKNKGLEIISSQTLHTTANGYTITDPRGLETQKVYISHALGIAPSHIMKAVTELRDKIFPGAKIESYTFMLIFYSALRDLFPNRTEACLIDITGEATEIAVVRNHELRKVSHSTIGSQTLTRILVDKLKLPEVSALSVLSNSEIELTKQQKIIADTVIAEYVEELSLLFKSMGDILTIPKPLFIHSDLELELFFESHIKKAAEQATGGTHMIFPVTKHIFETQQNRDSALFLSSFFFHKLHKQGTLAKK